MTGGGITIQTLSSHLSPVLVVTQPTAHTLTMVVLGDRDNQENEEARESSVIDSLTEEEVLTEKSELGR